MLFFIDKMHFFLVYVNFMFYFSNVNVIINRKNLITAPKFKPNMTPAILLVLSIITIHFRLRLFDLLSLTSAPTLVKGSNVEVLIPCLTDVNERIFNSYTSKINKHNNSLLIKILKRDCSTCNVISNSLKYRKTTDSLDYLAD